MAGKGRGGREGEGKGAEKRYKTGIAIPWNINFGYGPEYNIIYTTYIAVNVKTRDKNP